MEDFKDTALEVGMLGAFLSGLTVLGGGVLILGLFAEIWMIFNNIKSFLGFGE